MGPVLDDLSNSYPFLAELILGLPCAFPRILWRLCKLAYYLLMQSAPTAWVLGAFAHAVDVIEDNSLIDEALIALVGYIARC